MTTDEWVEALAGDPPVPKLAALYAHAKARAEGAVRGLAVGFAAGVVAAGSATGYPWPAPVFVVAGVTIAWAAAPAIGSRFAWWTWRPDLWPDDVVDDVESRG